MSNAVATEAAIERISHKAGVTCFVISGAPTKDDDGVEKYKVERKGANMAQEVAQQFADKFNPITALARSAVRDLAPEDDLKIFRIKCKLQEVIACPKYKENGDPKYHVLCVQTLPDTSEA